MKRVLFLAHTGRLQGAETVFLEVIKTCNNTKDVFVVTPEEKENIFKAKLVENGINNIYELPYKLVGWGNLRLFFVLFYNIYSVIQLSRIVKKNNISIIYSNTSLNVVGLIVARLLRIEHLWHFHEPVDKAFGWSYLMKFLYRVLFLYKKNTIVFISNIQKKQWESKIGYGIKNSLVLYNPIKTISSFEKTMSNKVVFGFLGSLEKRKNVEMLINVTNDLIKLYPTYDIELLIAGEGPELNLLKEKVSHLSLGKQIKFVGFVSDVQDFLKKIEVLVLPSFSETMPLVILESIVAKIPVIVTKNSGLVELLIGNEDCLYFDPYSSSELLNSMKVMLDADQRLKMQETGYDKILKYDFNNAFNNTVKELLES